MNTSLCKTFDFKLSTIKTEADVDSYSIFVLEASASNRLTYFFPPLNLIPLVFRPLRLFLSAEQLRVVRIALLKATHFPHIIAIKTYERFSRREGLQAIHGSVLSARNVKQQPPQSHDEAQSGVAEDSNPKIRRHNSDQKQAKLQAHTTRTLFHLDRARPPKIDQNAANEVLSAIKALEATVLHLTKQVDILSAEMSTRVNQS